MQLIQAYEARHHAIDTLDTGVTTLCVPQRLLQQLGMKPFRTRRARTSAGIVERPVYGPIRLVVQGRDCLAEAFAR